MDLADIQKAVICIGLDGIKCKVHLGVIPNSDQGPSSFYACALVHLSLKPGKTSTRSSGGSPRITSRRTVDVGYFPAPTIPTGENSDIIFRIPSRLLLVFSVCFSTFLVTGI